MYVEPWLVWVYLGLSLFNLIGNIKLMSVVRDQSIVIHNLRWLYERCMETRQHPAHRVLDTTNVEVIGLMSESKGHD